MDDDNGFSLLKLLAESELHNRIITKKKSKKQISSDDTNGIAEMIKDTIGDQTITIDNSSYNINAVDVENNSILLWVWSDSDDDEKTIKITLRVDELDVNSSYWNGENV